MAWFRALAQLDFACIAQAWRAQRHDVEAVEQVFVLMALTPGVTVDGHVLNRGDAIFLPAEGRRVSMTGEGAQILAAYPDLVPTNIWKHPPPPRPAALALDPATVMRTPTNLEATMAMRPAA